MLAEAEDILAKRLLFREDGILPTFDLYSYRDNPRNRQAGHYFALDDPEAIEKTQDRMMKELQKSPAWRRMMEYTGDDLDFNPAAVKSYEEWDIRFRRLLLLIMALTCGLSGRGPEIIAWTYMNTLAGDRKLLLKGGQFVTFTEYHKSQAIMDMLKV